MYICEKMVSFVLFICYCSAVKFWLFFGYNLKAQNTIVSDILFLMFRELLLATVLALAVSQAVSQSQRVPLIGGFQTYTDLQNADFKAVLAFVYQSRPELVNYKPINVQRQLVNGFNYRINLRHDDGCSVDVTVYATFQGTYSLSDQNPIICPAVTINTNAGGYQVQTDPSGEQFEEALSQALSQNNYRRSDLVLTQTQVVAGTNYRFTFRNNNGSLSQNVIFVPLVRQASPPTDSSNPVQDTPVRIPIGGGWQVQTDPKSYAEPLAAIYNSFPEVKVNSYRISAVESQVVAGMNYRIAFQKNSVNTVKYALFNVFVNLGGQSTVRLIQWIDFSGYSVAQVIQNYNDSLQLHARLQGSNLVRIDNIWRGEGLAFRFQGQSQNNSVFIYSKDGRVRNLIY